MASRIESARRSREGAIGSVVAWLLRLTHLPRHYPAAFLYDDGCFVIDLLTSNG